MQAIEIAQKISRFINFGERDGKNKQGVVTENKGTCWERIITEASPEEQP